jgi:IS30 family transposase
MNDTYTRLCGHDRKVIANMAQAGNNQKAIAKAIGRSQGTISKELRRNRGQRGEIFLSVKSLESQRAG